MKSFLTARRALVLGLALSGFGPLLTAGPALAQVYDSWQPGWDAGRYNHRHMLVGTVSSFTPYRMQLAGPGDRTFSVDLQRGTVIRPLGLNLAPGEHVAVVGYWSNGTFIAHRVVLRRG